MSISWRMGLYLNCASPSLWQQSASPIPGWQVENKLWAYRYCKVKLVSDVSAIYQYSSLQSGFTVDTALKKQPLQILQSCNIGMRSNTVCKKDLKSPVIRTGELLFQLSLLTSFNHEVRASRTAFAFSLNSLGWDAEPLHSFSKKDSTVAWVSSPSVPTFPCSQRGCPRGWPDTSPWAHLALLPSLPPCRNYTEGHRQAGVQGRPCRGQQENVKSMTDKAVHKSLRHLNGYPCQSRDCSQLRNSRPHCDTSPESLPMT